jgi:hypothetical protein
VALTEVRLFNFADKTKASLSVRKFERNVAEECARLDKAKPERLRPVPVPAGARYQANAWDLVLAESGAAVVLPDPTPENDGIEIAIVALSGAISIECSSGGAFVRGVATLTYSTQAALHLLGTSGGYW